MSDTETLATLVIDDTAYETRLTRKFAARKRYQPADPNQVRAVIPGVIQAIHVEEGGRVTRGVPLLVLEAMKMRNDVTSACAGTISHIHVRVGDMVTKGQLLVELG
jgi:glutaconyl-CoA/methylmalonyl-CoA decarboxylase subunit gamma